MSTLNIGSEIKEFKFEIALLFLWFLSFSLTIFFLFFVFFENVHLKNRRKFWNKLTLNRWCCFKTFYWRGKEERKHVQNTLGAPCFCNRLVWKIAIFNCEYLGDAWFNWAKLHIMFIWIISNTFHYNWTVITKVESLVNLTFKGV